MKRVLLAFAATAALPLAAQAGDLSYNYLQAGYSYAHGDGGRHAHGWEGEASAGLGDHFQVFGGGGTNDRNNPAGPSSGEGWNLGAGFHTGIGSRTDFVGDLDYHRSQLDGVSGNVRSWAGEVGVRSAMSPHFEGWAMAGYQRAHNDIGHVDRGSNGEAFGKLGGQYKFTKNWGLVAEGRVASHDHGIFVGPRVSF